MASIFLTGASGFLGTAVRDRLRAAGHRVLCLQRSGTGADVVAGDLCDSGSYAASLAGVDTVIHLAAITGKAPPDDYQRINVDGTRTLLEAAQQAGVQRFLFCSSIAVKFPDKRRYHYALAKAAAEQLVLDSPLAATIIRPTIVAGTGSPVMSKLAELADMPMVPLFGKASALVQPIDVGDLADFVTAIVEGGRFDNEILELGGPEAISLRELLDRLHRARSGNATKFMTVPLFLVLPALAVLERLVYGALPITTGQLATFRFDGDAATNMLWSSRRDQLVTLDRIIADTTRS